MFYSELTMLSYIISQNDQIFSKICNILVSLLAGGGGGEASLHEGPVWKKRLLEYAYGYIHNGAITLNR